MKTLKTVLLTLFFVVLIGIISCRSYLDEVLPVSIDKRASEYAGADPDDFGAIVSLADAKRVKVEIILNHRDQQIFLKRQAEDDNLAHGDALGFIDNTITVGDARMDMLIGSEDQPFSLLGIVALLSTGGIGLGVGKKFFKSDKELIRERDEKVKNGDVI